jgi:hypothetical protein
MRGEIQSAFERGDTTEIIHLMDRHCGMSSFSVWHLFREEQRNVLNRILEAAHAGIEASFRKIYEDHGPVMNFLSSINIPIPKSILLAAEQIVNGDIKKIFEKEEVETEKLKRLILESNRWGINLDKAAIEYIASLWVTSHMEKAAQDPANLSLFQRITDVLKLLEPLSLNLNLWKAQNIYFSLKERLIEECGEKAKSDESVQQCHDAFNELGQALRIKVLS